MRHRSRADRRGRVAILPVLLLASITAATALAEDHRPTRDPVHEPWTLDQWCSNLRAELRILGWSIEPCTDIPWQLSNRRSVLGKPIPVVEFGDPGATNSTLVVSMVHGDENTPLFLALRLARHLVQDEARLKAASIRVVIAPLVNPDGFFRGTRTRTNAHKVDLNRNLPTKDWAGLALRMWKTRFGSNARRFPGSQPASEPETAFQTELVERIAPQKILSIHAPLNFTDFLILAISARMKALHSAGLLVSTLTPAAIRRSRTSGALRIFTISLFRRAMVA